MNKTQNDQRDQNAGSMINQKTNEDYNKEKPNPNDPNFKNPNPNPEGKNMRNDGQETSDKKMTEPKSEKQEAMKTYTCSMHPEVKSDKPGKCPKCGMDLMEKKQSINSSYSGNSKRKKKLNSKK